MDDEQRLTDAEVQEFHFESALLFAKEAGFHIGARIDMGEELMASAREHLKAGLVGHYENTVEAQR